MLSNLVYIPWYVEYSTIAIVLMIAALVLQWAYRLVCGRNLRYHKAYSLLMALFSVHLVVSFIKVSAVNSHNSLTSENGNILQLLILFLVGVLLFGRWMNTKRKKPIGSAMGFLVQLTFCGMLTAISLVVALPFIIFL